MLLRIDVTTVQLGVHELFTRGGVEDTRLAAKAKTKDAKKVRDQGQKQTFEDRPSQEAKDRNAQGQSQGKRTLSSSVPPQKRVKK